MGKSAVIIYGPPGSGKSTQARLVADAFGLIFFDTGKYIEAALYDPKNARNPIFTRERKNFEAGLLCTPSWVLKIVTAQMQRIVSAGYGVVLSASPRTIYEAFGDKNSHGLFALFERGYGKKGIFIFELRIVPSSSLKRNSLRKICSVCGTPLLGEPSKKLKQCPFCGGKLYTRTLDRPKVIKARLLEFKKRTMPIFKRLKAQGFKIHKIDGEAPPHKVFSAIKRWL